MRFTVWCDRKDCADYVAHCPNPSHAETVKRRHDLLRGHDARIDTHLDTPFEGLLL